MSRIPVVTAFSWSPPTNCGANHYRLIDGDAVAEGDDE
jgi:hypothetical protein